MILDSLHLSSEIFMVSCILLNLSFSIFSDSIYIRMSSHYNQLVSSGIILFFTFINLMCNVDIGGPCFFFMFEVSRYIQGSKLILIFFSIILLFFFYNYLLYVRIFNYEYYILFLLSIWGMLILISSMDLLSIYLSLEIQSFCLYLLVASKKKSLLSIEAGLKYYVLGGLSSGLFLFGCSLIYGNCGMTNILDIHLYSLVFEDSVLFSGGGVLVGFSLIFISLLFKLGAAPFHVWVPDVYSGSPIFITGFLSSIPKMSIYFFLIKLLYISFRVYGFFWSHPLVYVCIISLFFGVFGSLYQVNIKRLLAYSGISHVGILLMGLCTLNSYGVASGIFYGIIYLSLIVGIFSGIILFRDRINNMRLGNIFSYKYISKNNLCLCLILSCLLFSLAGIPPFLGFLSKFFVFHALIDSDMYLLAFFGVFSSILSTFYYIRIIRLLFFDKTFSGPHFLITPSFSISLLLCIVSFFHIFGFFLIDPLLYYCNYLAICLLMNY